MSGQSAPQVRDFVVGLFKIIDSRQWDTLPDIFAEACVYHRPGYEPIAGLQRLEHFYREERIITAGEHEIEDVVGDLSTATCTGRFRGYDKAGHRLDEQFCDLYRLDHGKIVLRRTYFYRAAI